VHAHQIAGRQTVIGRLGTVGKATDEVFVVIDQAGRRAVGDVLQKRQLRSESVLDHPPFTHVGQHRFDAFNRAALIAHRDRVHLGDQSFATGPAQAQFDRGRNATAQQHVQVNAQQIGTSAAAQAKPVQQIGPFGRRRLGSQPLSQGLVGPHHATGWVEG